jgi:hypothetical protein
MTRKKPASKPHVPPTCEHCGSVLSAVTFTCVRGDRCPGPVKPGMHVIDTDASGNHYPHVYRVIKIEGERTLVRSVGAVLPGGRMQYDHNFAAETYRRTAALRANPYA